MLHVALLNLNNEKTPPLPEEGRRDVEELD